MPVTRQKPSAEWIALLNEAGVPCGPIYKINESFADPQVQHLAMAQPVHSPALGDLTILGHPVSFGAGRSSDPQQRAGAGPGQRGDPDLDRLYEGPDRRPGQAAE